MLARVTHGVWAEPADGIFLRSYESLDVNICVIRGDDELAVVDSRSSAKEASELQADLRALAPAEVTCLVNTHAHFDHTFGNQNFASGTGIGVPIFGHHLVPEHLAEYESPRLIAWQRGVGDEPPRDWSGVVITAPTVLLAEETTLRVGTRVVELIPLGPGHTDTDLAVHIPDAHVWIVGDVVEASGPPMFGSGCFPLDFPRSLGSLVDRIGVDDIVIPGHGPVVDRAFVERQLLDIVQLSIQIRAQYDAGVTVDEALASQSGWPFPVESLHLAVRRAFETLNTGNP